MHYLDYQYFEFVKMSNDLSIKNICDLTCHAVERMIEMNTLEEISEIPNIKNDFTPKKKEVILKIQLACK